MHILHARLFFYLAIETLLDRLFHVDKAAHNVERVLGRLLGASGHQ